MTKIKLNYIPVQSWIIYPNVDRLLNQTGKVLVLPPYYVELVWAELMTGVQAVCMYMGRFLEMFSVAFPQSPGGFPYIFLSTVNGSTLITVYNPTLLLLWVLGPWASLILA